MFEQTRLMFLYAVSPVHMGAGTALGAIDNPIQRERHTNHPMAAGSGLKGAMREAAQHRWKGEVEGAKATDVSAIFGPAPDEDSSEFAGCLSVADAQLALLPVRSLRHSFVYATCPTALGRLQRAARLAGIEFPALPPEPEENDALVLPQGPQSTDRLVLEAYDLGAKQDNTLAELAEWIGRYALPSDSLDYFRGKLTRDLVVLHDRKFDFFSRNATVVEPHVRIDDETGTADDGGLFYTENLPPESLLVSTLMSTRVRKRDEQRSAQEVLDLVTRTFGGRLMQIGGNATTGRGQVLVSLAGTEAGS